MAENKKFTRLINSDGTKQAVALDMISFDEQTKKLTLYSSVDNTIKEETTIPASEVDATLSQSGLAADAKATGDAVKDVVKVGGTASGFTGIIVGTGEEEIELVEQKDFDAEIAKLNAKVGTPLVANTASAMVDTTKIYVYTGNENGYVNGNWYFYNGTNWESGGVYNAVAVQTDKTLTQENKAADAKKTGDEISQLMSDFADMQSDGVVPSAEQILTNKGVTDCVPYHYRKTGGDGADRLYDQIVGGTVNWNQLLKAISAVSNNWTSANTVTPEWGEGEVVLSNPSATWSGISTTYAVNIYSGHKYIVLVDAKVIDSGASIVLGTANFGDIADIGGVTSTSYASVGKVISATSNTSRTFNIANRQRVASYALRNPQLFDLTAMFGSTIADYIYQLEQTTGGAGVAFFKSLFPNDYYPYNAGELVSVGGLSEHKMVGFNQWDEEWEVGGIGGQGQPTVATDTIRTKNYNRCLPNTTYYINNYSGSAGAYVYAIYLYDADKNFIGNATISSATHLFTTPSNCHYFKFRTYIAYGTTYNHDICINLSDPAKNGTYEPYKAHSYPLDSTVELRGIPKLDNNNKLYFDGDVYEYTGKVTRNTILRAYQSGDESLANAITDGTNTVVYSANASAEQADPYQHLQQCDPNGTEEYVSTGIVPVGHNSFYPENLKAKIEGLPWNFASLIAPTESAFVATRNYTTGALFIVDNVLYKATSNIANGGTITPNTNCTATTLAEIISALA